MPLHYCSFPNYIGPATVSKKFIMLLIWRFDLNLYYQTQSKGQNMLYRLHKFVVAALLLFLPRNFWWYTPARCWKSLSSITTVQYRAKIRLPRNPSWTKRGFQGHIQIRVLTNDMKDKIISMGILYSLNNS